MGDTTERERRRLVEERKHAEGGRARMLFMLW